MNTGTWTLVAWLCILGFVPVGTWLGWHYGRHHERTEGKHRRTADRLDREWDEWRAKVTAPWEVPGITDRQVADSIPAYPAGEGMPTHPRHVECAPGPRGEVRAGAEGRPPGRKQAPVPGDAVTAADIGPVIVPPPKLTDTGELRALTSQTDAWLEGMRQKGLIT